MEQIKTIIQEIRNILLESKGQPKLKGAGFSMILLNNLPTLKGYKYKSYDSKEKTKKIWPKGYLESWEFEKENKIIEIKRFRHKKWFVDLIEIKDNTKEINEIQKQIEFLNIKMEKLQKNKNKRIYNNINY